MNFYEAEQKWIQFSAQLRSGQITSAQFADAMTGLRVTDSRGTIWQPSPSGDGWIFWTGSAWQPGIPEHQRVPIPGSAYIPPAPPETSGSKTAPDAERSQGFNEFKSSLMTVDEFKKISKNVPLAKRPQKWWDLLSILGGVAGAILWLIYGGIRSSREGFDLITPLLMIAIPVILVWFRGDIDPLLQPLQPYRKKISKIILIGVGIATPFLTAWVLYNIFHISQYPLMQVNIVVGTLVAYAVTRDPKPAGVQPKNGTRIGNALVIFTILLCSCIIVPVVADDCSSDPLNAQDCLRTDGYAEIMAGLVAAILSALINGPIIIQTLLQGGAGGGTEVPLPLPPVPQTPSGPTTTSPESYPGPYQNEGYNTQEEGMAILRKQKKDWEAAEAAAKVKAAEAAAKARAGPPVDPVTKKNILTPEQEVRKSEILADIALNEDIAQRSASYDKNLGYVVVGLKVVEKTADIALDIGATLSPGVGSRIKNIYGVTKTMGKNISQSYVDGKGVIVGFEQGVYETAADKALGIITKKYLPKYNTNVNDYGDMTLSQIKGNMGKNMLNETGGMVQDLNNLVQQNDPNRAVSNSLKNAMQARTVGLIWDPVKKAVGISKTSFR